MTQSALQIPLRDFSIMYYLVDPLQKPFRFKSFNAYKTITSSTYSNTNHFLHRVVRSPRISYNVFYIFVILDISLGPFCTANSAEIILMKLNNFTILFQ